jgi:BirA family biotin operon repressor/biotin-[acetyl-CoA-carboxylase] ligase
LYFYRSKLKKTLSLNVKDVLQAPVLWFGTLDSTNNCAAQMIDADKAQVGLTILAEHQTAGKGQRGHTWLEEPAQSVLMSIVLQPKVPIDEQFSFSAAVAVAIADVLQACNPKWQVRIKFPNDIIINDKKAAGILIENSFRGQLWATAIVGVGLNVLQVRFPSNLAHATSLYMAAPQDWDIPKLAQQLRAMIISNTLGYSLRPYMERYNQLLYRRGLQQIFATEGSTFAAEVVAVNSQGLLQLRHANGSMHYYPHGQLEWVW